MTTRFSTVAGAVFASFYVTVSAPACANELLSSSRTGHVEGQIVLYPAFPVARAGEPNQRSIPGQVAIVDATGAVVAQVTSDQKGSFQVDLPPGRYTLHLTSLRWPGSSEPQPVTVESGQVTKTVLIFDAGIR